MFIYIDLSYYRDAYKGEYATIEDIQKYIDEANFMVGARVGFVNKDNLAITPKMLLEQATAREVDYLVENPQAVASGSIGSISIGSFSMSGSGEVKVSPTSKSVDDILLYAGLLNRGVCIK